MISIEPLKNAAIGMFVLCIVLLPLAFAGGEKGTAFMIGYYTGIAVTFTMFAVCIRTYK